MASNWNPPVVFVVENNLYGMSVPFRKVTKLLDIANRACAYGIPGEVVDGMDVLAVRGAVEKAAERARKGEGPTLIECKTYRWFGHSHSDPRAYRTREEEAGWKQRDPIIVLREAMKATGLLTDAEFEQLDEAVEEKLRQAMAYSEASAEPSPDELCTDVYAPAKTTPADVEAERKLRERVRAD